MTEKQLIDKATEYITELIKSGTTLAVAESCTGGFLSKIITEVSGVSAIYKGGICSYANEIKINLLGVKPDTLSAYGAVSEQTAREMAQGIRRVMSTQIGIGITGIAGPKSDNTNKPVGLIYVAIATENKTVVKELRNTFTENIRTNNRLSAVETALNLLGGINE